MAITDDIRDFELALFRRGLDGAEAEKCGRCGRTPLVGEHVHVYAKRVVCDLCVAGERLEPIGSRLVHTPAFGHSIRIVDQRSAA
jgi:hypothetical protein